MANGSKPGLVKPGHVVGHQGSAKRMRGKPIEIHRGQQGSKSCTKAGYRPATSNSARRNEKRSCTAGERPYSFMWAQMNGTGPPVRLFAYAPGRGTVHAEKLYAGIRPGTTLMSDGYEVYNGIAKAGGLTHLGCWVHARRPLIKAEEAIPKAARSPDQLATRFVRLIGKLYRAESLAKDWTPARRLRLRSRYSAAVVREIERLLLTHLHAVAPSSLLGEALHYLHGQWPKLVRFLDNGAWPLDSNPVENAIRPFVVGRRSWLFADTVGGANASANLYSLIETAKANNVEPYRYLVALFKKLPLAQAVDDYEALLPWTIELVEP